MKSIMSVIILPGIIITILPFFLKICSSELMTIRPVAIIPYFSAWGLIIYCAFLFDKQGKGTIAPWAPPTRLVISGPFTWTRNPIFLAMIIGNFSLAFLFNSLILTIYSIVVAIIFQFRIIYHEEPFLAQKYGNQWREYCSLTNRWFLFF